MTLEAVGLHVSLIDAGPQELMLLKMQRVNVVKTNRADGSVAVAGTLGKLEVVDCSAPASLHTKSMTVRDEAHELVHLKVELYDKTSVYHAAACEDLWQVCVSRPRITLLWRFISEILQYQHSFFSVPCSAVPTAAAHATFVQDAAEGLAGRDAAERTSCAPSASTLPVSSAASAPLTAGNTSSSTSASLFPALFQNMGPKPRSTVIKINLEHPELILPRSSTSTDALHADLGRIDVERASRNSSGKWIVSFHKAHLDSMHSASGGHVVKLPCVQDLDGTAHIRFCETDTDEPAMSVEINLDTLRGSITDQQYALIMSIFGENFTEKRAAGVGLSHCKPIKQISHLAEDGTLSDKLNTIIDNARRLSAHRVPISAYDVTIRDIELAFNRSKPYGKNTQGGHSAGDSERNNETQSAWPLLHAKASDLKVRYESFASAVAKDELGAQGLDSSVTAELQSFELVDTRIGAVRKSEPLFCVRKPMVCDDGRDRLSSAPFTDDGQEEDKRILIQMFRLSQGHMGIDLRLCDVDTVFDIGLLMNAISFLGTFNPPPVNRDGFAYVVTRAGGFRVFTDLPNSSIRLVTAFDRADADGFNMNGSLSVTYASSASEDVLHVKVDDLVLKVHDTERSGIKSNHSIDVVRPCGVIASWQWYRNLDQLTAESIADLLEADHKRRPKFFFAASEMRAMVTYENMMLAMRVYSCLMSTLADTSSSSQGSQVEIPSTNECLSTEAIASQPTADPESQNSNEMRIQGSGIMLTLVDDFEGRWIPLVRIGLPKVNLNGNSSAMHIQLMGARLDYFHGPTSCWKAAVEDVEMWVRYLTWEEGGSRHHQLQIDSENELMTHVSRAAILSCCSALNAWSQDRRRWGIDSEKDCDSRDRHTFVPYTVQNMLAEPLILITEDGSEYRIESQHWIELSYAQVWGRSSELSKYARDCNDTGINNMVCMQLASARQIFGSVSIELEQTVTFEIEPQSTETGTPALIISSQLYRRNSQKFLRIFSMVSIRNCTQMPLASAILGAEDATPIPMAVIPSGGVVGVPLHLARDGIVLVKPVISGLEYDWCNVTTEAIRLHTVHDGTFRVTQMVDLKFQRIFGAALPADTTLLHWYPCANDLQGVGLRQGVLYLTDRFLCHHSSIMGNIIDEVIPIASIIDLKKINTMLVIPNAIRVQTAKRTYYFRTFTDRAETFREIVKLLPNKSVVSQEDDVDEKTRQIFNLEPSDTILSMYSANMHHDPGFTEGKVLLTTHHILFLANDDFSTRRCKIAWSNVLNIEKRKSFLVRNNAVYITARNDSIFLSSGKWDRDKVVDEEMIAIWRGGHQALGKDSSLASVDSTSDFSSSGVRCRTLTCNVVAALKTPRSTVATTQPGAPGRAITDASMEYERQLQRSLDAVTFTISVVDCVTQKKGADRKAGNPCTIDLHAPWVIENLTCFDLEVQLVDKTRSIIARAAIFLGSSRQMVSVDLRRELRLRARIIRSNVNGGNHFGPWSPLVPFYSTEDLETESSMFVPDITGDGSQEVVVEVAQDQMSCGFRVCLYNRFWILNVSGLRIEGQRRPGLEHAPNRLLPLGTPVGWDGGEGLEIKVPGFGWSSPFSVTDQSENKCTVALTAEELPGYGACGGLDTAASMGTQEMYLEVSASAGIGRFDRTIVITIAPVIIIENCLPDAEIIVWQRATPALPALNRQKGPRITLAVGETRPFYPEGITQYCRLSINLKTDGAKESCAVFAPDFCLRGRQEAKRESDTSRDVDDCGNLEPILLRLSSGRLLLLLSEVNRANTIVLKVFEKHEAIPHCIFNRSYFTLHFRQVGDRLKRLVIVEPWKEEPLVWPEPTELPRKLVLEKIDGTPVPKSAEVVCDDLLLLNVPLYMREQRDLLNKALSTIIGQQGRPEVTSWLGSRYLLRLNNPDHRNMERDEACAVVPPPLLIQLTGSQLILNSSSAGIVAEQVQKGGPASNGLCVLRHEEVECATAPTERISLATVAAAASTIDRAERRTEWVIENIGDENGIRGHGVWVNTKRLSGRIVLKHGDRILLGLPGSRLEEDKVRVRGESGIVYIFEDYLEHQKQHINQASNLQTSVRLGLKGTKVINVHVGLLSDSSIKLTSKSRSTYSFAAPALSVALEDEVLSGASEEVLFMSMKNIKASVFSDGITRQFHAQVLGLQIDNQFDCQTQFPVVLNATPATNAALNVVIIERIGTSAVHRFFEHIRLEIGEAFIFLDDKLMVRMAAFLSNMLPQGPPVWEDKEEDGETSAGSMAGGSIKLTTSVNPWEVLGRGIMPELSELRMTIMMGKSAEQRLGPISRSSLQSDPLLYVQRLKVRPLMVHLTLMSTGEGGSRVGRGGGAAVIRQYAGAMLERMMRKVRIDDVIVNVPEQERSQMLITQSAFSALISDILLQSLKKSFFSAKFMLKGLDAWSDRLLGLQTDGQMAGNRHLKRLRPLDDEWVDISSGVSGSTISHPDAAADKNMGQVAVMSGRRVMGLGGRAITWGAGTLASVPQLAGGMVKQVVKKGVAVADKGVRAAGEVLKQTDMSGLPGRLT